MSSFLPEPFASLTAGDAVVDDSYSSSCRLAE